MAESLDWLIVGGGPHGVHLAARLIGEGGVAPERLALVDPEPRLLATWRRCAGNTGMQFLRSPVVHHLDLDPFSLKRFGGRTGRGGRRATRGLFRAPYDRPAVGLFDAHCDHVLTTYELPDRHIQDRVAHLALGDDGVRATLGGGEVLAARQAILAVGASAQPRWPAWASQARVEGARIRHVFDPGFVLDPDAWPDAVAVVGGGISAAQVALRLVRPGRDVHLVTRHALREHLFDSDPGWVGPKHMRGFRATADPDVRRGLIDAARHRGSVPPDVLRPLQRALERGRVRLHQGKDLGLDDGVLRVDDTRLPVEAVLLATGFEARRPGGPLVDALVEDHGLACARCGYPIVDPRLRWHPRLHVTGPLAELELGPVSRNLAGARRAADRIVPLAKAS